jgi:ribosomal protein L19
MNVIQTLEAEQIAKFNETKKIPEFRPGDTPRRREGRRRRAHPRAEL